MPAETGDDASHPGSKRLRVPTSQGTWWQRQQAMEEEMEEEMEGGQHLSSLNLPPEG